MTLAYGKALKDEVIARIAAKHNATPAQVILAWAMGEGYSVIPSSTKRKNLESNLNSLETYLPRIHVYQCCFWAGSQKGVRLIF